MSSELVLSLQTIGYIVLLIIQLEGILPNILPYNREFHHQKKAVLKQSTGVFTAANKKTTASVQNKTAEKQGFLSLLELFSTTSYGPSLILSLLILILKSRKIRVNTRIHVLM